MRSLTAWLHRVTVLQCRSAIRRRQRERRHQLVELWEQSREQQRTFSEVMPRRVADRAMQMVRERGLGSIVTEILKSMSAGSAP